MTESEGRAALKGRFEAAGLTVVEDFPLVAGARDLLVDGFDPARKIGYEILTSDGGDRVDITPEVIAALEAAMEAGEYMVFLIDEADVGGIGELEAAADAFLAELRRRGKLS